MVHLVQVRADATRNAELIIAAARELIARHGADVSMDALARRAGVAVGTLYRHFPTKQALVSAVVDESIERIAVLGDRARLRVAAGAAPGPEVAQLFREVADQVSADRAVKAAAAVLGVDLTVDVSAQPLGDEPIARAVACLRQLLEAAHRAGQIAPSVTVDDLLLMVNQLPGDPDPAAHRRYVQIALAGLGLTDFSD